MPVLTVTSISHPHLNHDQLNAWLAEGDLDIAIVNAARVARIQVQLEASEWTIRWQWRDGTTTSKNVRHDRGGLVKDEYVFKPWGPQRTVDAPAGTDAAT
jgi:hypothetical protein